MFSSCNYSVIKLYSSAHYLYNKPITEQSDKIYIIFCQYRKDNSFQFTGNYCDVKLYFYVFIMSYYDL